MKYVKRTISLVFCIALILCGCEEKETSEINITGNPDPAPISDGERTIHKMLNIEEESDYDNLFAEALESTYNTSDDSITCKVTDRIPGKGFYYYEIPFIEKNINGEWIRFLNKSNQLDVASWFFCGIEGNTSKPNSCNVKANLSDFKPKIDEGEYRFVIFTADKMIYANFNVEE